MPRLRRSRTTTPGIRRIRRGKGFSYLDTDGQRLRDEAQLERIAALAIPPAWRDVWISPFANDHIQATGLDVADRRQYLYHPAWRVRADGEKFERMLALASVLPRARRGVAADLEASGLGRDRVLAGAFRLLDVAGLRIGSPQYAAEHGSYGLCTLLVAHAEVRGNEVRLRFPAKSGQRWASDLEDAPLAELVGELCGRSRRARLFAWRDDAGRARPLRPEDINDDIRRRTGGEFTAKDLRTLHGTVTAARSLASAGAATSERAQRRAITEAIRCAAEALGNTPAIARASYVDPRIIDRYERGETVSRRGAVERELVRLLGAD